MCVCVCVCAYTAHEQAVIGMIVTDLHQLHYFLQEYHFLCVPTFSQHN
jgi:hypothetical protein